jgi:hypothetical protein
LDIVSENASSQSFDEWDIPSSESGQNTEGTASSQETSVGRAIGVQQVCETKEQECKVKGEEEREEGDSRTQSADQQQESEDEPAHEVESERVEERRG